MIAYSEGTAGRGDNGYNVMYGGSLFENGYVDHPRQPHTFLIKGKAVTSTAAGRYQLLARFWDVYKKQLALKDFGHDAQDAVAWQQIRECRATADVEAGRLHDAVTKCARIWASLPGAGYGQHEQRFEVLEDAFLAAGGTVA